MLGSLSIGYGSFWMIATGGLRAPGDRFFYAAGLEDLLGQDIEVVMDGSAVVLVVPPHLGLCRAHGHAAVECGHEPYISARVQGPEPAC